MIPDIRVFGEGELVELVRKGEVLPARLISIGNPWRPWLPRPPGRRLHPELKRHFRRILRLRFWDVDNLGQLGRCRPRRIPEARDVRRVLRFWRSARAEAGGLVIHCWRGTSRSAAMALGLLRAELGVDAAAGRALLAIRPEAQPNPRIAALFDRELGSDLSSIAQGIFAERIDAMRRHLNEEFGELYEELEAAE